MTLALPPPHLIIIFLLHTFPHTYNTFPLHLRNLLLQVFPIMFLLITTIAAIDAGVLACRVEE